MTVSRRSERLNRGESDVASIGTLCGGCRGEHRYAMRWMTRRAPVRYVVDDVASTGTLCVSYQTLPVNAGGKHHGFGLDRGGLAAGHDVARLRVPGEDLVVGAQVQIQGQT